MQRKKYKKILNYKTIEPKLHKWNDWSNHPVTKKFRQTLQEQTKIRVFHGSKHTWLSINIDKPQNWELIKLIYGKEEAEKLYKRGGIVNKETLLRMLKRETQSLQGIIANFDKFQSEEYAYKKIKSTIEIINELTLELYENIKQN